MIVVYLHGSFWLAAEADGGVGEYRPDCFAIIRFRVAVLCCKMASSKTCFPYKIIVMPVCRQQAANEGAEEGATRGAEIRPAGSHHQPPTPKMTWTPPKSK